MIFAWHAAVTSGCGGGAHAGTSDWDQRWQRNYGGPTVQQAQCSDTAWRRRRRMDTTPTAADNCWFGLPRELHWRLQSWRLSRPTATHDGQRQSTRWSRTLSPELVAVVEARVRPPYQFAARPWLQPESAARCQEPRVGGGDGVSSGKLHGTALGRPALHTHLNQLSFASVSRRVYSGAHSSAAPARTCQRLQQRDGLANRE